MKQLTLIASDGWLYLPGHDTDEPFLLVYSYPEGDCDVISSSKPNFYHLFVCLYDAVNTGDLPDDCEVFMPDGQSLGKSWGFHFVANGWLQQRIHEARDNGR